jgi:hypothetical protein
MSDDSGSEAESAVYDTHLSGITTSEIVIHRHDMDICWHESIEICSDRGHESLPFAGTHLSDITIIEREGSDELDIIGDHIPLDHIPTSGIEALTIDELTGTSMKRECLILDRVEDLTSLCSIFEIIHIESLES